MKNVRKSKLLIAALVASGMFGIALAQDYVSTISCEKLEHLCKVFSIEKDASTSAKIVIVAEGFDGDRSHRPM